MGFDYLILGAGQQGTAAAYDLARWGRADRVVLGDLDGKRAQSSAERINRLISRSIAQANQLDVSKSDTLVEQLCGYDACLSAVPYYFNAKVAEAAIAAETNFCDLGGNTEIVRRELALIKQTRRASISIVPDCGLAPGMANTLAVYAMERLEAMGGMPQDVRIYCGGLPQTPRPPLSYKLVFSIEGLTNEYFGRASILRDGKVTAVECLTESEELTFPLLGRFEAFMTSGGTSTCPETFEGKLRSYEYKTLRYPGHLAQIKTLRDLGLLSLDPIEVDGQQVVPRALFHRLAAPRLDFPDDRDLVALRVCCVGELDGEATSVQYDLIDYYDEATGFAAMERMTGFPAAIVASMLAQGQVEPGAVPLERAIPAGPFMRGLLKRDIRPVESISRTLDAHGPMTTGESR
jgi:lysine 6-dehydrogenase